MQLLQIDSSQEKKLVRSELRKYRAQLSDAQYIKKSHSLSQNIFAEIISRGYKTALLFSPVRREPDISELSQKLRNSGVLTAFPVSHKSDVRLEFRLITDDSDFTVGEYGIKEPSEHCPTLTCFDNSVCIVPALSIDVCGMRIGYGKGYYDRFLKNYCGDSIGVVFSDFIVDKLPIDENDVPLDLIITEREVFKPNEKEYSPLEGEKS